ncbi:TetR family transcriptional regulator [Actinocatenispora thailandica]|uniref:TetR family transcriptional regulator n=1 Tax=Actinocatenispora thailandica TaxID=227318 RepID=A0A7R7HVY2_9ACTN|nr:TetR/AcrR family transcriptional regulator [Actinocatenispora thailandica]BCJ33563.1 TetR family transcriptional regulator [Actinocatenispora thailandica]
MGTKTEPGGRRPPRERLLAAANELFYAEGVHTVGIDRIIERAGVAKASLYSTFGSKDELVRSYLAGRHARIADRVAAAMARSDNPREQILAIFDSQTETCAAPGFNGCPFVAASAESPRGGVVEEETDRYRAWLRGVFADLAAKAGVTDPTAVAHQLHMIYDGTSVSARMDHDPAAVSRTARAAAAALLDAAT